MDEELCQAGYKESGPVPTAVHSLGINGEGRSMGHMANPCSPGKMATNTMCVRVCMRVTVFVPKKQLSLKC